MSEFTRGQTRPLAALVRNAVHAEAVATGRRKPVVVKRLLTNLRTPELSADERVQYQAELAERADFMEAGGMPAAAALDAARDLLGCPEFWAYCQEINAGPLPSLRVPPDSRGIYSEVERAQIRAWNAANLVRLRAEWAAERRRSERAA